MRAAIYARVSTDRQERNQTIDSQLTALRGWVTANGHELAEAHVFRDEGCSGSRLDRPALDRLRDAVRDAEIDLVAVHSPDRLARKYAYQVLLLEEFRRAGCAVAFLLHPISDDPNDQLLLQIQGAIAEYERAVLAERFRRGKLQKAREGHAVHARPPYGYRFVARHDGVPARLVLDEAEADLVRQAYAWFIEDRLSLRQLLRRLNFGPWYPRSGRRPWSASTVHHLLSDPVYTGTAYANRYEHVAAKKPRAGSSAAVARNSRRLKPKEQWIAIPVPALVDQTTWDRAQDQLARNARLAFRNNAKHNYLLRCLMTCGTCGRSMHGRTSLSGNGNQHQYYSCAGKDRILSARDTACPQVPLKARDIEHAVWEHVAGLLGDPAHLVAQFARFVTEVDGGTARDTASGQPLSARLSRLDQADRRLIDAYQAGILRLEELSDRRAQLAHQRRALEREQQQHVQLCQQHAQAKKVLANIAVFAERIRDRLQDAAFADRQAILQLVIERIIVHEDGLEIRHVIPLRNPRPDRDGPIPEQDGRLRSDSEAAAHVLSAFACEAALILAHQEAGGAPEEIPATPALIEALGVRGVLFTADALHAQKNPRGSPFRLRPEKQAGL
jgi:site-specific DNA recombinase